MAGVFTMIAMPGIWLGNYGRFRLMTAKKHHNASRNNKCEDENPTHGKLSGSQSWDIGTFGAFDAAYVQSLVPVPWYRVKPQFGKVLRRLSSCRWSEVQNVIILSEMTGHLIAAGSMFCAPSTQ
jgi:hypothetical protein